MTSLRFDREVKVPLYASSNIPETWIVDLDHNVMIVCRSPSVDGYTDVRPLNAPGKIVPMLLPECAVDLASIF